MATFTIDLLTGKVFLFSGDFTSSGGTSITGSTYSEVNIYSSLPLASSASNQIYVVRSGSGTTVLDRKPAGLYFSNGSIWKYLGDVPDGFKSNNFQIIDSSDTSKGIMFVISGITTNTFRNLTIQNADGTIAYLVDLNAKVDKTVFANYTGTTAPATFLSKSEFNAYSGTTVPATFLSKSEFNVYSGSTYKRTAVNALSYTPLATDKIIGILSTSGGTVYINLPNISIVGNNIHWIFKDEGFNAKNNNIIFSASTGNYIEKSSNISLNVNGGSITLYNDGGLNWYVI